MVDRRLKQCCRWRPIFPQDACEKIRGLTTLEDGLSGDLIFAMPLMGPLWRLRWRKELAISV